MDALKELRSQSHHSGEGSSTLEETDALPAGPTNQHIRFKPSSDEVASFSHNGITEFPGTIRGIKMISANRAGWRATVNGTTTDVVLERNRSRYRTLESVRTDGKTLVKNGFIIEQASGLHGLRNAPLR